MVHVLGVIGSNLPPISAKQQPRNNYLRALTSARGELIFLHDQIDHFDQVRVNLVNLVNLVT